MPNNQEIARIRRMEELPELLTRSELALFTNVSIATLARWSGSEFGPRPTKLGHAVRYRRSDVMGWLDSSAVDRSEPSGRSKAVIASA